MCNRDQTLILIQRQEFHRYSECRSTGFYQSKECVQVQGSVHLKTYWCFTQADRQTTSSPANHNAGSPPPGGYTPLLIQDIHSYPANSPFTASGHTTKGNSKNILLVILVTLNVHLEELCSLQQSREVVFSHTGLTTVHEFYKGLEH